MTVIDNLLIAAPILQNLLVDKFGNPLVNGVVTLFQDTDRTVLKNWYYETGSPGSYSFVALDNPMTLSAAGSIQDPSGSDTIPFFYPYDETSVSTTPPVQKYYITVTDSQGNLQFTRQDFPYDLSTNATPSGGGGGGGAGASFENLVVNNEFWRNIGSSVNPYLTTNTAPIILAPSQHDAMRFPDIEYIVVGTGDTETISFVTFSGPGQTLTGDVTPEYYLDFDCTVSTGGETSKIISIPLSTHLLTLAGFQGATFTVQANVQTGNGNLEVNIVGDYGSNGLAQIVQHLGTLVLNSSWTKYTLPVNFPDIVTANISTTADDGWYLQFVLPNTACEIQVAKPSVFLSATVPTNDFATYDQIDAVINSPRTGDIRTSLNAFSPYGWVPANDGQIGSAASAASTRHNSDTWPLYNFLWTNVSTPSGNTLAPVNGGLGASAFEDFINNKFMTLPLMLGRVLMGLPPAVVSTGYNTGTGAFTVTSPLGSVFAMATPILVSGSALPSVFMAGTIYYAIPINATSFALALNPANARANIPITGGTAGTPNFTLTALLASNVGETTHVQSSAEVGPHIHPLANGSNIWSTGAGNFITFTGSVNTISESSIANNTPAGAPFNIVQASVYLNVFLKL
jgi:hypothetical protein